MNNKNSIFVVEDNESARRVLEVALSADYEIETFVSAEDCLTRLSSKTPDLFLLDVGLPGIDGYKLCQKIKTRPEFGETPVIFISALDDLESRLQGYDAGGIDFIVKPYAMAEIKQKIKLAINCAAHKSTLRQQIADSDTLASLVLSNLDEYSLLIRFLRTLNGTTNYSEVADALFSMMRSFKLNGAVQLRLRDLELTIGQMGNNSPLETSIIEHVRTLGSIFEFKTRAVFNFPHLTILVNNMPVQDRDLCGRLRDHLAIAAESADANLDALQTRSDKSHASNEIVSLIDSISQTVRKLEHKYDQVRYQGTELTQSMLDEMSRAFTSLGLSEAQEDRIQNLLRDKAQALATLYDFGDETQTTLKNLASRLSRIVQTQ